MSDASSVPRSVPHRRWFAFRLRTVFVLLTVLAAWLGWELQYVRERQAWVRSNPALLRPGEPVPVGSDVGMFIYSHPTQSWFPFWRRWLGDAPVSSIVLPQGWTDHHRVQRLFPEAELLEVGTLRRPATGSSP